MVNPVNAAIMFSNVAHLYRGATVKIPVDIWDKVFKNRPSKICGRQPLKI